MIGFVQNWEWMDKFEIALEIYRENGRKNETKS